MYKKYAFGILELLIVIIIAIAIYFGCFHPSPYGKKNPFDDNTQLKNTQQIVDDKVQEIEDYKVLKQNIEKNLQEGN